MATTAKGTPYVESSDLVANYPAVSLALAEHIDDFGGKILQVVRATDSTERSTTSTSFVDVTGMSVTITPQKADSNLIIIAIGAYNALWTTDGSSFGRIQITNSSNVAINGAENMNLGLQNISGTSTRVVYGSFTIWGYVTPGSTAAITHKLRFRSNTNTTFGIRNDAPTGQMFAIEVSA